MTLPRILVPVFIDVSSPIIVTVAVSELDAAPDIVDAVLLTDVEVSNVRDDESDVCDGVSVVSLMNADVSVVSVV